MLRHHVASDTRRTSARPRVNELPVPPAALVSQADALVAAENVDSLTSTRYSALIAKTDGIVD